MMIIAPVNGGYNFFWLDFLEKKDTSEEDIS
jgi:hypothetical protein